MPDNKFRETIARQWELLKFIPKGGVGLIATDLTATLQFDFKVTKR